jgi:MFS family permease
MLSAPWLLIAFLAGATQKTPRRAALLGLGATAAALTGYWLMTDSPVEGAQYTLANARGFLVSNAFVVVGGLVTGPLFGWFGHRWRTRRALLGALVTAAALCLEPLVRHVPVAVIHAFGNGYVVANPIDSSAVTLAEVAAGLALAAAFVVRHRRQALRPEG